MLRRQQAYWNTGKRVPGGALAYTPPLDVYTGAIRAYGFRLLRSAYTGPLFEIRNVASNTFLDVYPESDGLVDEAAVFSFIDNGGVSYQSQITKLYDQTGNGLTMPSFIGSGNVPYIIPTGVSSSNFEKINTRLALKTEGGYFYDSSPFMYAASANSFIAVIQGPNTNPTSACLIGEGSSASNNPAYLHSIKFNSASSTQASHFVRNDANTIVVTSNVNSMGTVYNNSPHIMYGRDSGSNFRVAIDDVSDLNVNYSRSGTLTLNRFSLLGLQRVSSSSVFNNLKLSEIILYNSNQDSNIPGLMSNLNAFYGTF